MWMQHGCGASQTFSIILPYVNIFFTKLAIWSALDLDAIHWLHYSDVIPRGRLRSPASRLFTQPFIQTQIKENIKAPRHWPLCGEVTGTGEFPAQRASNAENASIGWPHHDFAKHAIHSPLIHTTWRLDSMGVSCWIMTWICLQYQGGKYKGKIQKTGS